MTKTAKRKARAIWVDSLNGVFPTRKLADCLGVGIFVKFVEVLK